MCVKISTVKQSRLSHFFLVLLGIDSGVHSHFEPVVIWMVSHLRPFPFWAHPHFESVIISSLPSFWYSSHSESVQARTHSHFHGVSLLCTCSHFGPAIISRFQEWPCQYTTSQDPTLAFLWPCLLQWRIIPERTTCKPAPRMYCKNVHKISSMSPSNCWVMMEGKEV